VNKLQRHRLQTCRNLFSASDLCIYNKDALLTEIIPYLCFLPQINLRTSDLCQFVQELGRFAKISNSANSSSFLKSEGDVIGEIDEDSNQESVISTIQFDPGRAISSQQLVIEHESSDDGDDNDYFIEECDD